MRANGRSPGRSQDYRVRVLAHVRRLEVLETTLEAVAGMARDLEGCEEVAEKLGGEDGALPLVRERLEDPAVAYVVGRSREGV